MDERTGFNTDNNYNVGKKLFFCIDKIIILSYFLLFTTKPEKTMSNEEKGISLSK